MANKVIRIGVVLIYFATTSCATIVNSDAVKVAINTVPSGATVSVDQQTYVSPANMFFVRGSGAKELTIEKKGYAPEKILVRESLSGWIWGNLFFGGIFGLVIDFASGSAWKYSPESVFVQLKPNTEVVAASFQTVTTTPAPIQKPVIFPIRLETRFSNESWFPLPKDDMKAAVEDAALSEITKSGLLKIVTGDSSANGGNEVGSMDLNITLIESIETIKLTVNLTLPGGATFIASDTESLKDQDAEAIFKSMTNVGKKTASEINSKLLNGIGRTSTN